MKHALKGTTWKNKTDHGAQKIEHESFLELHAGKNEQEYRSMSIREKRAAFEKNAKIYESGLLNFHGVDGFDVYNCSIPFLFRAKNTCSAGLSAAVNGPEAGLVCFRRSISRTIRR